MPWRPSSIRRKALAPRAPALSPDHRSRSEIVIQVGGSLAASRAEPQPRRRKARIPPRTGCPTAAPRGFTFTGCGRMRDPRIAYGPPASSLRLVQSGPRLSFFPAPSGTHLCVRLGEPSRRALSGSVRMSGLGQRHALSPGHLPPAHSMVQPPVSSQPSAAFRHLYILPELSFLQVFPQHSVDPHYHSGPVARKRSMMSGSRRRAISFYRRFCPVPLADQEVTLAETHPEKRLIGYARVST